MIKNLIKTKKPLHGVITDVIMGDTADDDALVLKWEDLTIYVYRPEIDIVYCKAKLEKWINVHRNFIITGYDLETGKIYASFKLFKELKQQQTLKTLEKGPVEATVTALFDWGAYLTFNKTTLVLFNNKCSADYAIMKEYMKLGDTINVKFFTVSDLGFIEVEAVDKYKEKKTQDIADLKPRDVLIGRVRTVKIDRIYVKVASGLDVMCPVPSEEWYNPEPVIGDLVAVRLTQVHYKEVRLRGKIQGKLESEELEFKAGQLKNYVYLTKEEFESACDVDSSYVFGNIEEKALLSKNKRYY